MRSRMKNRHLSHALPQNFSLIPPGSENLPLRATPTHLSRFVSISIKSRQQRRPRRRAPNRRRLIATAVDNTPKDTCRAERERELTRLDISPGFRPSVRPSIRSSKLARVHLLFISRGRSCRVANANTRL